MGSDLYSRCPHPEHGNIGIIQPNAVPRSLRGEEVNAHAGDLPWFVGKFVKVGVPIPWRLPQREYMWFEVSRVEAKMLHGTLANTSVYRIAPWGAPRAFTFDEIVDVCDSSD